MAGIYIHIPFCKQACHYCNFYFSTSLRRKTEFVEVLITEIRKRKNELEGEEISTIYFGGGTPSLLNQEDLDRILGEVSLNYKLEEEVEITLEANPDDLTRDVLESLKASPVNRLSIGIQSFFDEDLRYMNRAHDAQNALDVLGLATEFGFENISIDLIYGCPTSNNERWLQNLEYAIDFDVPHISAYALTVEPKTALERYIESGKSAPVNEEQCTEQFKLTMDRLESAGFEHYEISNFSKPGRYSNHNSSYWAGKTYIGFGPSAHSFDGTTRRWNVSNLSKYLKNIREKAVYHEHESLSPNDQYNEYIMTRLRTKWGISVDEVEAKFGTRARQHFLASVTPYVDKEVRDNGGTYVLTTRGKLFVDGISAQLFMV